ncbi:MAG: HAMP domain-containing protein [Bacteroidetes bacterium]|nr:HAMP domain-containing protein [Bacteroidota bacterium]HET6244789.1 ATP-binding protein [Bacteroidia bacterium]
MEAFKNISIRNKLIVIQLATAFIAVLICSVIFVIITINTFKEAEIKNKYSLAEIVGVNAAPTLLFDDNSAANQILEELKSNPSILNAIILDKTGKEFAKYSKEGEEDFSFSNLDKKDITAKRLIGNEFIVRYKIFHEKEFLGSVILKSKMADLNNIIYNYIKVAAFVLFTGLIVALLISVFLQRLLSNRLLSLVKKTKEITETGDYSSMILFEGKDEIAVLSRAINKMLGQIEKTQDNLKEANIHLEELNLHKEKTLSVLSHDLRSPLNSIIGTSELLKANFDNMNRADLQQMLILIHKSSKRLSDMLNNLVEWARIKFASEIFSPEKIQICMVVKDVFDMLSENALGKGISLQNKIIENVFVWADGKMLHSILQNLISNAIKFTPEGGKITATSETRNNESVIRIIDTGHGMSKEAQEKLFTPQVDSLSASRQEKEGAGIGLLIVKGFVEKNSGKIWVESEQGKGTSMIFTLPLTH